MNIESAQRTVLEAKKQMRSWANVIEQIWIDSAKSKIIFLLKKGKMHPARCQILQVLNFNKIVIQRLDNGKTYKVDPYFLKWPQGGEGVK